MKAKSILYTNESYLEGLDFLSIVKQTLKFKRIRVAMLDSLRKKKSLVKVYDFGISAYVVKQIGIVSAIITVLPSFRGRAHEQY
jgi:hypothetical protein